MTNHNGFTFSTCKSKAMHFLTLPGLVLLPQLRMSRDVMEYVDEFKFLGIIWDKKLSWKPHIENLKNKCKKSIMMLHSISSHDWGGYQHTLLHLCKLCVRSKLDYGCTVKDSATNTVLKEIDQIVNESLRIASGALKSTPIPALHIITNEMPSALRGKYLSLRYYLKIKSHLSNPAHPLVIPPTDRLLFRNKQITLPFGIRTLISIEKLNVAQTPVLPAFSYRFWILRFQPGTP